MLSPTPKAAPRPTPSLRPRYLSEMPGRAPGARLIDELTHAPHRLDSKATAHRITDRVVGTTCALALVGLLTLVATGQA